MKFPMNYGELKRRYPLQVAEAIAEIRNGRSKDRYMSEEDMQWSVDWYTTITSYSVSDLMNNHAQTCELIWHDLSAVQKTKDIIRRSKVWLSAKAGRAKGTSSFIKMPREIAEQILEGQKSDRSS